MNDRQRRFVEAYVALGNATRAAKEAGYSEDTAYAQGHRLLKDAEIRRAVDELNADIANQRGATRQYVIDGLMRTYQQAIEGAPKVHQGEVVRGEDGQPIREWSPAGAAKALELLGKAHGMWIDRAQVEQSGLVEYTLSLGEPLGEQDEDDDDAGS